MKKKSLYFKDHPYTLYESVKNSPFPLPTNSLGLIGKKEYGFLKEKNVIRILVLGASPIERLPPPHENISCNPNLTVTHFLEENLNKFSKEKGINKNFEVLNLSSSGFTSYECLISYMCKGRLFSPDLIISYQGVNDIIWSVMAKNFLKDYSHARRNNFHKQECLVNDIFCLLPSNKFVHFLDRVFLKFNLKKPNGLIFSISKSNLQLDNNFAPEKLEVFIKNIEMLDSICKLNNAKLINFSFVWDKNKPANPIHIYKELRQKKYKLLFKEFYNNYLNEINRLLINNQKLETFIFPDKVFNKECFSDGVHFNLKGMKTFSYYGSKYILKEYINLFKLN